MRQNSEHTHAPARISPSFPSFDRSPLRGLQHRAHLAPPLLEEAALSGQGHRLVQVLAITEMVASFIVSRAKARRCRARAAATHGVIALFDAAMILLDAIVQIATRAMLHVGP